MPCFLCCADCFIFAGDFDDKPSAASSATSGEAILQASTRARAINPWGSWVVTRGRQSMGPWIAPVLLLVRCLVRASIHGVVGTVPQASMIIPWGRG